MIPLAVPNLVGNEKKYLDNCIDSTFVSSVGEYVTRFEGMVAKATGSYYAVATNSGTAGLHAALTAMGVKYGDLVIIPTFTFIASANAVAHCGAIPWCMDISPSDWCLNPGTVRSEIAENCERVDGLLIHKTSGRKVAALMPVYTLGNIPDMSAFRAIADEYGLPLIVDAACAIGAEYKHSAFGTLADLSVLSFNGNKTVTCGGGGAVVGNDEKLLHHVKHLTTTARVWPDYDFDEVGYNYRMTNIQAAIGVAQMERIDELVDTKRKIHDYYEKQLHVLWKKKCSFFSATDGSSCWLSGIVLPPSFLLKDSKEMCSKLRESDIDARPFWKPVHLQVPYAQSPHGDVKVADGLWQRIITLPCATNIEKSQLDDVINKIKFLFE